MQQSGRDEPVAASVRKNWRRDVQGMRGLTILTIVAYHAGLYIPGGFVSLDVFFVVSGFVITGMILRGRSRTGHFSLREFFLRRVKRLTPALLVTVMLVLIFAIALSSPITVQDNAAYTGIGAVFLSANVVVQFTTGSYFSPWAELNPLLHIWSLSLEEQFYLMFPLLLAVGWLVMRRSPILGPVLLTSGIFVISLWFALFGVTQLPNINPALFGYYSPIGRVWEFAAGALLAFATVNLKSLRWSLGTGLGVLGIVLLFVPMWIVDSTVQYPGPWTLVPVTATILLLLAGFHEKNPVSRILASSPLTYAGNRSYSWYLWHWPVIVFAFAAFPTVPAIGLVAAVVSIVPALFSYRFVEQWSRYGNWTDRTIVTRVGVMALGTLAIAGGVLFGASQSWGSKAVAGAREMILEEHLANRSGCHIFQAIALEEYDNCWFSKDVDGQPVILVGDSNADHLSDGMFLAAQELRRPFFALSASSCPFILSEVSIDPRCKEYIETTVQWLGAQDTSTVVISTSGSFYSEGDAPALKDTVEAVRALGHEVVLVKPAPFLYDEALRREAWDPSACTALMVAGGTCVAEVSLEEAEARQGSVWTGVESAAGASGAVVLDISEEICPDGMCRSYSDGNWIYRDFNHLTADQSRRLAPAIADVLARD